ncbi:MAG TPA: alpha/beta hydrolase, partial [Anaerolineaceae bacterium]|nr:alpha/beta hydrolase [Anaerolineaceae bacterium]
MQIDKNQQKQSVTLESGVQISYLTAGDESGAPVVLLHGGGTDHALLSWRDTIPTLVNAGYRVFAPDFPGYGSSPLSPKPATVENLIGYLEALMDHWGVQQAALTGISMGGAVAIGYTLRHPERVNRLVLIGPYGIQDRAPAHRLSYFLIKIPGLMNAMWAMMRGSRWAARYSLKSILSNPAARTEAMVDEVFEAMRNPHSQKAFYQFQWDEIQWRGTRTNYTPRLGEISVPVLLVHGEKDAGVPVKDAKRAARLLPGARLE